MKTGLIGAGFVGQAVLHELINRGHKVTVLMRHPEKLKAPEGVTILAVDAQVPEAVAQAVKGLEIVISAFNAGWTNPNLYDDFLAGSKAIQAGVKAAGVPRLIVVGGAGSLFGADGTQLVDGPHFPAEYKAGATAARDYLTELRKEKELDWTFFSPAIEMNPSHSGLRKGHYRIGTENPVLDANGRSILSVEDLAMALVDELEKPQFSRQRFTAAY